MGIRIRFSHPTLAILDALLAHPAQWHHGYAISLQTSIPSGTLYPILMRLDKRGWLETRWENSVPQGRPPRHLYRLTGDGREWAREELRCAAVRILEARRESGVTMTSRQPSLRFWLAHASLQLALRLWPEESRDWGHALAAELDEIEKPFEALRWAIGGIMLFSRASASHFLAWLKLPAGSALSSTSLPTGVSAAGLPKRSRLFTVAMLLATAVVVCLPQSREAISTVRGSWNGYRGYSTDVRALRNLAARAEKERDARTLAFVALAGPDTDSAMALADHAVAIDPSLVWIRRLYGTS